MSVFLRLCVSCNNETVSVPQCIATLGSWNEVSRNSPNCFLAWAELCCTLSYLGCLWYWWRRLAQTTVSVIPLWSHPNGGPGPGGVGWRRGRGSPFSPNPLYGSRLSKGKSGMVLLPQVQVVMGNRNGDVPLTQRGELHLPHIALLWFLSRSFTGPIRGLDLLNYGNKHTNQEGWIHFK